MSQILVQRVSGGYRVDGLDLLAGSSGLPPGSGGGEVDESRRTYATVRKVGNVVAYFAKAMTAEPRGNYEWGYRVKKGAVEVDVLVYGGLDRQDPHFRGHYPPPVSAWAKRGWEITSQFARPLRAATPKR